MDRFFSSSALDIKTLSPLTLAYIGDGVYELMMREHLLGTANCPASKLHTRTVDHVRASAQSKAAARIFPMLTEQESAVFLRGRNARTNHVPQSASPGDYHAATALECLFGWLYLSGAIDRAKILFMAANREEE